MEKHGLFQITQKVFFRRNEKVLILRDRETGFGDLPGGRMNENEFFSDWIASAKREIEEELGDSFQYKIYEKPILIHKHRVMKGNHPCIIIAYDGIFLEGDIRLSWEHDLMKWVDLKTYNPKGFFTEYILEAFEIYQKEIFPTLLSE